MLTPEKKKFILEQEGLDPSIYDLSDDYEVIQRTAPLTNGTPLNTSIAGEAKPEVSQFDTLKRGAAESVIPFVGANVGRVVGGTLGAPLGPPGLVGGSIVGSIIGGLLAGKAQDKLLPEEFKQEYFLRPEDIQANPWTSAGASLVPNLATANPIKGAADLAGVVSKLPNAAANFGRFSRSLTPAEIQVLKEAAVGSAVGVGSGAGVRYFNDQPTELKDLVTDLAGGALFNANYNNRFNKAIGLHPPMVDPLPIVPKVSGFDPVARVNEMVGPEYIPSAEVPMARISEMTGPEFNPRFLEPKQTPRQELVIGNKESLINVSPEELAQQAKIAQEANIARFKKDNAEQNRMIDLEENQNKIAKKYEQWIKKSLDDIPYAGTEDTPSRKAAEEVLRSSGQITDDPYILTAARTEAQRVYIETAQRKLAALKEKQKEIFQQQELENLNKALEEESEIIRRFMERENAKLSAERIAKGKPTPEDTQSLTGEIKYSKDPFKDRPIGDLTKEELAYLKTIAARRGFALDLKTPLPEGVYGMQQQSSRQVKVDPKNAFAGTIGHEVVGHGWVEDLKGSKDKKDRDLYRRAMLITGGNEEKLADLLGEKILQRSKSGGVKGVYKDLVDWVKYKYKADDSKALDIIARSAERDVPYGQDPNIQIPKDLAGSIKFHRGPDKEVEKRVAEYDRTLQTHIKTKDDFNKFIQSLEFEADFLADSGSISNLAAKQFNEELVNHYLVESDDPRKLSEYIEELKDALKAHWLSKKQGGVDESSPFIQEQLKNPKLKTFLKGTKVTYADGTPMIQYHGTMTDHTEELSSFKKGLDYTDKELGTFVGEPFSHFGDPVQADVFAKGFMALNTPPAKVYPVWLSIKKPLEVTDRFGLIPSYGFIEELKTKKLLNTVEAEELTQRVLNAGTDTVDNQKLWIDIVKVLEAKGYDGFKYVNNMEGNAARPGNIAWVPFRANQVKSVFGNSGEFSKATNDIRYSKQPTQEEQNERIQTTERSASNISPGREGLEESTPTSSIRESSGGSNLGREETTSSDSDYQRDIGNKLKEEEVAIPLFQSQITKVAKAKGLGEAGPKLAGAFTEFFEKYNHLGGAYREGFMRGLVKDLGLNLGSGNIVDYVKGNSESANRILQALYEKDATGKISSSLTPKEEAILGRIQDHLKMLREDQNRRPGLREGSINEDYFPEQINPEVINELVNSPLSKESQKLKKDFLEFTQSKLEAGGLDPEKASAQANQRLNELMLASTGKDVDIASQFGPIDKAAGLGLPDSWKETNLLRALSRYTDRFARRIAFHDSIEASGAINLLKGQDSALGNKHVARVVESITGVRSNIQQGVEAVNGVVKSMAMGALSGLRDVTSTVVSGAQHSDFISHGTSLLKSLGNFSKNWDESFTSGINKTHIGALENLDKDANAVITGIRRFRDILNDVQGRQLLEQVGRTLAYGQGKILAASALGSTKPSKQQAKFLEDFRYKPDDSLETIAQRYAESVTGRYDARGLPHFTQEGPLSPIFSLNRWNIDRANNFVKYVINPAKKGNFRPLMNQTLWGAVIGGLGIEALNKVFNEKDPQYPTAKEIEQGEGLAGNDTARAYRWVNLGALAGYTGEMGSFIKYLFDKKVGNNTSNYQWIVGEYARMGMQYGPALVEAIKERDLDKLEDYFSDLLESTWQTYRVALRKLSSERREELSDAAKFRERRIYEFQKRGEYPYSPPSTVPDPDLYYSRKFKRSKDLDVEGFQNALQEAIDNSTDREDLARKIRALKYDSTSFFPDMERNPFDSIRYMQYLGSDNGPDRYIESVRMKAMNQMKSQMVPSL